MSSRPNRTIAPRFSLRVLLIVMLLAGPLGGFGWKQYDAWQKRQIQREATLKMERERRKAELERQAFFNALLQTQLAAQRSTAGLEGEKRSTPIKTIRLDSAWETPSRGNPVD